MGKKLGFEAKLYYKIGGVAASAAWNELTNCKDLTLNLEKGEADVTTRAAAGWRSTVGTLRDASIEFEMVWDTEDEGFGALLDVFLGNTDLIGIAVMDGDISTAGSQGLQADCDVLNFTRNEPLEEALTASVTIKPTYSSTAPSWETVAAS